MGLSVQAGVLLAGWQTGLAADSMQQHLASAATWIHFALYSLGGFILFAFAMVIPAAIVAAVCGAVAKSWESGSVRRFLLAGLIGTMLVAYIGSLDYWLERPLIADGYISLRTAATMAVVAVIVYFIAYVVGIGALQLWESRTDRSRWGLVWGWWFFMVTVPPLTISIRHAFTGSLRIVGLGLIAVIAIVVFLLLLRVLPRVYDILQKGGARRQWIPAAILLIVFFVSWPLPAKTAKGDPSTKDGPPVVLITIDTLRPDALGCYPAGECLRLGTPNMDRLASEGTVFERAYATAPWTRPSVPSYLSGLPPSAHGAFADESCKLASGATTLAEILREAGYATCGLVVNSILRKGSGNEQGFDVYIEEMTLQERGRLLLFQRLIDRVRLHWPEPMTPNSNPVMEREAIRRAKRYIMEHSGERFFLWIHLFAPHSTYYPPEEYRKRAEEQWGIKVPRIDILRQEDMIEGWPPGTRERLDGLLALYAGEVAFADDNVGEVLATLTELGILDDCLVILSSDHGEEFYEHDRLVHGRSLNPEVLHVPLIIRWPGRAPAGGRIKQPVSLVDIPPTVLDLVGAEASLNGAPAEFAAESLVPLLSGETMPTRPVFFERPLHFDQELKGVLYGNLYYIGGAEAILHPRLYDLADDPKAYYDILRERPDEAEMLSAMLDEYDAICAEIADRIGAGGTSADIEQLKALGYVN